MPALIPDFTAMVNTLASGEDNLTPELLLSHMFFPDDAERCSRLARDCQ